MAPWAVQIADPIHSFIGLTKTEKEVVDTEAFQRLRNIHQLQQARLVFPTAVHTRFSHSIGAMEVAQKIASSVGMGDHLRTPVRLATLLHDLGHGPFSHLYEHISRWIEPETGTFDHEDTTLAFIQHNEDLRDALGDRLDEVRMLLDPEEEGYPPYVSAVLSGPFDADKMDYTLRDAYFSGLQSARFDFPRLIDSLEVFRGEHLVLTKKGIHAFDQFRVGRMLLGRTVHHHHAVIAAEEMIRKAVECMVERNAEIAKVFSTPNDSTQVEWLLGKTDRNFLDWIHGNGSGRAKELVDLVRNRRLYKRAGGPYTREELTDEFRARALGADELQLMKELERELAEGLGVSQDRVIAHVLSVDTKQYLSVEEEKPTDADIQVKMAENSPTVPFPKTGYPVTAAPDEKNHRLYAFLVDPELKDEATGFVADQYLA